MHLLILPSGKRKESLCGECNVIYVLQLNSIDPNTYVCLRELVYMNNGEIYLVNARALYGILFIVRYIRYLPSGVRASEKTF